VEHVEHECMKELTGTNDCGLVGPDVGFMMSSGYAARRRWEEGPEIEVAPRAIRFRWQVVLIGQ